MYVLSLFPCIQGTLLTYKLRINHNASYFPPAFLEFVKLCSRHDRKLVFQEHLDGFFRDVEAEDDDGVLTAFFHKGVKVFDVDGFFVQDVHNAVEPAWLIGNFHGHDDGFADAETGFFEDLVGFFHVIDDQTQNAEIGCFRERQGADVDVVFLQDACGVLQRAGFVFQKNRDLFYLHV